jgi:hypothetical protein
MNRILDAFSASNCLLVKCMTRSIHTYSDKYVIRDAIIKYEWKTETNGQQSVEYNT